MEWTGARFADTPTIEQRIRIEAPPERVWQLVSDIALLPSLSSELQAVEWLDDGGPVLGARFRGRNKHPRSANGRPPRTWSSTSRNARSRGRSRIRRHRRRAGGSASKPGTAAPS
ncbi:SRPBCC family protein [Amycolatopsis magusensis]|uniref:SRPBCC family protein n=1 Tax=Amycolatopsis magusensis TaxID=882444 RepID=UPI003C2E0721